jgi:pentatricopeptide repeat protein
VLAVAATIGGYAGVTQSLAYVLRNQAPERAYALSSGDGRITGRYAGAIASNPDATPADRRRADALARRALRQDPSAVLAIGALALDRQIGGDVLGARRLFGYAERLSRRELQIQIWAIEDAVRRGDIPNVLRHYDIALRTSRNAPDLLFPILGSAIVDPVVRRELARTLAASPAWAGAFMNFAARRGADPHAAAQLFTTLRRRSIAIPAEAAASVVDGMIQAGQYDEAWRYYAAMRRSGDRRRSRDPGFTVASEVPTALDWSLVNDENVSSSIQRTGKIAVLEFSAPPSVGGPVLRQMQLLPAGDYRLSGFSEGIDQTASALPYWTLTCHGDGRELGRVELPNSAQSGGAFRGTVRVPANCPVQLLTLVARPSGTMLGLAGRIRRVELAPAQ